MKHFFLALLLVATACSMATPLSPSAPAVTAIVAASATPEPTAPPTSTATPAPTATPEPTNTSIIELDKATEFSLLHSGGDGGLDMASICLSGTLLYTHVLYADRQLVLQTANGLAETKIPETQFNELVEKINQTGILQVEGDGSLREADPIFRDAPRDAGDGAPYITLTVKEKVFYIYTPLEKYLVNPIKRVLEIIRSLQPNNLETYIPKRLELFGVETKDAEQKFIQLPILQQAEVWPNTLPSLAKLKDRYPTDYIVLNDQEIELVVKLFVRFPSDKFFEDNGKTYYVVTCPSLP